MDWTQTLTIIISVFGLFLVAIPFLISRMDSNKRDTDQKFELINGKFDAVNNKLNGIENRLTSLEAEAKNTSQRITDLKTDMNQRLSNIENCVMPRKVFHFEESHKGGDEEPKEN